MSLPDNITVPARRPRRMTHRPIP